MPFLKSSTAFFTKRESTAGTSADPLDKANGYTSPTLMDVRIRDLEITVDPEKDDEDSKYLTGDFTGDEAIVGKIPSTAKFTIKGAPAEWNSSQVAQTHKLNYAKNLETAGLQQIEIGDPLTVDADYTYQKQYLFFPTTSASVNTITATEVVKDEADNGIATEIVGAVGNITIGADGAGKPFNFSFDMAGSTANDDSGIWSILPIDMAKLDFDDDAVMKTVASRFINTSISIINIDTSESVLVCSAKVELQSSNTVTPIECQQSKSGVKHNLITEMKPRLVVTPQLKTLAEFEYWKGLTEQNKYIIDIRVDYDNANNIYPIRIVVPNAQILSIPRGEDGGILNQEITFRPLRNINKVVPTVKYYEQAGGTEQTWDHTGTALEGKEAEAMWYLIIGEEEVTA